MLSERQIVANCLCHRTRMTARAVTRLYDDILRPAGIRATQLSILASIGAGEVQSISSLASFIGMERSTLTRNLAPLKRDGLIRIGNEGWRRSRTLEITKKGRTVLTEALPLWKQAQDTIQRKLGARKWTAIRADLDDLVRVAQ